MPLSLRRDRVLVYAHSTASADGYADESYTLAPNAAAPDGAYPAHVGVPRASTVLVAQQAQVRADAEISTAPTVPVAAGAVLMRLPTGDLLRVTGVTDQRRLRTRLLTAVYAEDAVYATIGAVP